MVPAELHDFFVTSGGVAGALIGLLFVAISVSERRLLEADDAPVHRIRAAAALAAFLDALTVSLAALVPGKAFAWAAVIAAASGILLLTAGLLSLIRLGLLGSRGRRRDILFLVALAVVFVAQLGNGLVLRSGPGHADRVDTIALLLILCFIIGVYRAWELIGGPSFAVQREVRGLLRSHSDEQEPAAPAASSGPTTS